MNYKSETPRTTLRYEADKYAQGAFSAYENMRDLAKELEVELAEAIESREFQLKLNVELNEREKQTHTELTAVTEQRDRLAEAAESRSGEQQNCKHCGSTEDFWWSRTEPMGYYCSNCGEEHEPEHTMNTDTPRTDKITDSGTNKTVSWLCIEYQQLCEKLETELTAVTEHRDRLADLVKQFIYILDITEESDSGRLFHPTNITSCRAGDLQKIGELVEALRRASNDL
jgi:hypothetical protein